MIKGLIKGPDQGEKQMFENTYNIEKNSKYYQESFLREAINIRLASEAKKAGSKRKPERITSTGPLHRFFHFPQFRKVQGKVTKLPANLN